MTQFVQSLKEKVRAENKKKKKNLYSNLELTTWWAGVGTAQWAGEGTSIWEYVKIWLINNSPFMIWITKINALKETFAEEAFL